MPLQKIDSYIARGMFILPLGMFGIMHFILEKQFEFMVPPFLGYKSFWVIFSGVALTTASISIFLKIYHQVAIRLLILFVITFILSVDIPMIFRGIDSFYFSVSLLKDTSLLGGCMLYYFVFKK